MRAASRALVGVVVALALLGPLTGMPPAAAQPASTSASPRCPAVVADQPLSVAEPFSGTVRPRAGADGRLRSSSLLCAYGEGATPAAAVTVTWADGSAPCATTEVEVAPGLDAAAFTAMATALAASAGLACGPSSASGWPLGAVAGGLLLGAALALAGLRRRRRIRAVAPRAPVTIDPEPRPAPTPDPRPSIPDVGPVLAALDSPGGRDFARTGAGQLAALAALHYLSGDSVSGDLARAGSLATLPVHRPARADAHRYRVVDR